MSMRGSVQVLRLAKLRAGPLEAGPLGRWRPRQHRASASCLWQLQERLQPLQHRHAHTRSRAARDTLSWPLVTAGGVACGLSLALTAQSAQSAQCWSSSSAATAPSQPSPSSAIVALERPVQLFQYDVCPFCNKVQAFLEAHGVPYEKHEVNPLSKAEIAFSSYKMVPLAMVNGRQVNGSANIIQALLVEKNAHADAESPGTSDGAPGDGTSEARWSAWVDDHLVHVLPPNIYRTPREAMQAFDYISSSSNFSRAQQVCIRYAGAAVMFLVAKRAKKKYGLSDDPRQDLFDAVETWAAEGLPPAAATGTGTGSGSGPFHAGRTLPGVADLAVFGVLRSIEGNYGTWSDLSEAPLPHKVEFWAWYKAIKAHVDANRNIVPCTAAPTPTMPTPKMP